MLAQSLFDGTDVTYSDPLIDGIRAEFVDGDRHMRVSGLAACAVQRDSVDAVVASAGRPMTARSERWKCAIAGSLRP